MKWLLLAAVLLIAAVGSTYARYESFDPCDWMVHDLTAKTGLPEMIVEGRVRALFLLDGITDPRPLDCLYAWWDVRQDGLPPES